MNIFYCSESVLRAPISPVTPNKSLNKNAYRSRTIKALEKMIASSTLEVIKEQHTVDPKSTRGTREEENISALIEKQKLELQKDDEYSFKNLKDLENQYHNKVLFQMESLLAFLRF